MNEFDRHKLSDPVAQQRFTGIQRLLTQLEILEIRIRDEIAAALPPINKSDFLLWDVLHLDVETYYTVAFDLLRLIERFLPEQQVADFRREGIYKTMRLLRNQLIRHAFDGNGDPYSGFGLGELEGVVLKAGTAKGPFIDSGFYKNAAFLHALFEKYKVSPSRRYQERSELRSWTG